MYREAVLLQNEVSKENHPSTLLTMRGLGSVFWMQGRLDEAQVIIKSALDKMNINLAQNHPGTIHCSKALGQVLQAKSEYIEAEKILEQTLSGVKDYLVMATLIQLKNWSSLRIR